MTMKTVKVIRTLGLTVIAGAMLSGSPIVSSMARADRAQAAGQVQVATDISPNTFHHWPNGSTGLALNDPDPDTFHHWPNGSTGLALNDPDPDTFHHWPNGSTGLASNDPDPDTFHHWPNTLVADLDPFTFHHWG